MAQKSSGILQVVNGDGEFDDNSVSSFMRDNDVQDAGVDYQVVAITGPQSSGKSTLMNALFGTSFEEMDAMSGRHQTTRGIWLARSGKLPHPATLVMDLEGSDGRERGEDDNSFERQSALFALAVADVLLVNMWAKDVGREAGAGKPLLKTIFQVNLKLFTPAPNKRRTVLLFVFRDRTRTPLPRLVETWEADLAQMWAGITKPPQYEASSFTDFFEVMYASLPNFEEREEDFRAESVILRRRFTEEGKDTLLRAGEGKLPGHALALSMARVWEAIREQRDLNLPAHKVMVANIRCAELLEEQLRSLATDSAWTALAAAAAAGVVPEFGSRAAALLESCITGYDEEARYFEAGVRRAKRDELVARARGMVRGAFDAQRAHLRARLREHAAQEISACATREGGFAAAASRVKAEALEQHQAGLRQAEVPSSGWDAAAEVQAAEADVDALIADATQRKVAEVAAAAQKGLAAAITGPAIALLESLPDDLWARLLRLLASALRTATQSVEAGLSGYALGSKARAALDAQLQGFARKRLEAHVREAANTALPRMKERFTEVFSRDEAGLPRSWGPSANVPAAARDARLAAARVLAQLAVLRLDHPSPADGDAVERAVLALAADKAAALSPPEAGVGGIPEGGEAFDLVAAAEWPGVAEGAVLLTPPQCRALWRQFASDSAYSVQQAQATQDANRAATNRMPPAWAIAAMVVLGFNEFLALLYNPLYIVLGLAIFVFARTVYQELDVDAEMARGLLPGALALSGKVLPAVSSVAHRTADALREFVHDPQALAERVAAAGRSAVDKAAASAESATGAVARAARAAGVSPTRSADPSAPVARGGAEADGK
ncbi:hypothetical protein WJX81_002422 [Elliptochloris bilobata]|uniref:Protein ROOT HAIR DEFECTIVE 3 homolog n=1 Tax=Elliptochloris bilobata TaxID=381761 RepID=A0AAW1RKG6_9CHLO